MEKVGFDYFLCPQDPPRPFPSITTDVNSAFPRYIFSVEILREKVGYHTR